MTDFMRNFLSLNQVGLGRLVALSSDADTPSRNYCEQTEINGLEPSRQPDTDNDTILNKADVVALSSDADTSSRNICEQTEINGLEPFRRPYTDNDTTLNSTSVTTLRSAISEAVTFLFNKEKKSKSHMRFKQGYTYELHNVNAHFDKLLDTPRVRKWLDVYQKTHKICMIVAFSTAVAAEVELDKQKTSKARAKGTVPTAEAIGLPGASQHPAGQVADLTAEVEHNRDLQATSKFKAPEERVILVCYQEVKFKSFFVNTKAPRYSLAKKSEWKALDGSRGGDGEEWVRVEIVKDPEWNGAETVSEFDTAYLINTEASDDESDETNEI